jgi:hypothetical protein
VDETGQYTADPLTESATCHLPANIAQPVWITLHVPRDATPGTYSGTIKLIAANESLNVPLEVEVLNAALPDPPDYSYYLNIWQDPNGVARAHKVKLWSEEHWRLLTLYAENLAQHGEKSIMTSIIHDPWNSQTGYEFPAMVEWKYPGEWEPGQESRFSWDFSIFDRYVSTMIHAGVRQKIDMYAMVKGPGGTPDASIRYLDTKAGIYRTEKLQVGDAKWAAAWKVFLPALRSHLEQKGWWRLAYLGFDEKPKRIMDQLFDFIAKEGSGFRLVMSGGHAQAGGDNEVVLYWDDLYNPEAWKNTYAPMVKTMMQNGQLVTWYTACEPRSPNTFIFSSLRDPRMFGWITAKYGLRGYTRWAVNAFPENIWNQPRYKWPSGDMFFLYPGENGPLDSMRWELLRQGIEDYEALRLAQNLASTQGRQDLLRSLNTAIARATMLDSCGEIPLVEASREVVNSVLRQLGGK